MAIPAKIAVGMCIRSNCKYTRKLLIKQSVVPAELTATLNVSHCILKKSPNSWLTATYFTHNELELHWL